MASFLAQAGGFLLGWVAAAYAVGMITEKFWHKLNYIVAFGACVAGGIVLLYLIGVPWIAVTAKISIWKAFTGSLPFIPGDLIKAVIASGVMVTVSKGYPIIRKDADPIIHE